MRTTFTSRYEVAHLWAHQMQEYAKYSGNNFYFRGSTIYSYGSHFPCGCIIHNRKGDKAYILNTEKSSNTTAKHMNDVRGSIPGYAKVFESHACLSPFGYRNLNLGYSLAIRYILTELQHIVELMGKHHRAIYKDYTLQCYDHCHNIRRWIAFWELDERQKWVVTNYPYKTKMLPSVFQLFESNISKLQDYSDMVDDLAACIACWKLFNSRRMFTTFSHSDANPTNQVIGYMVREWFGEEQQSMISESRKRMEANAHRRFLAKKREQIKSFQIKLEKYHNHTINSLDVPDSLGWNAALRINGENISTSKGISISMEEAKRLWTIVQMIDKSGTFKREIALDIHGCKWKFDSYENHVLHAGCHSIPFSECQFVANQMGW